MSASLVPCAASSLLVGLLEDADPGPSLVEVARTRTSVHVETGRDDVPVLCVCTPAAVRLPASVVSPVLPVGSLRLAGGVLRDRTSAWRVARWWTPPRPVGLTSPSEVAWPAGVPRVDAVRPDELVGRGPGLTPSGDDVLAGALVAAHATSDARLGRWRAETCAALRVRRTTAVSRALLQHAMDGYATPELAALVTAACAGDATPATRALLAVGHTSGAALAAGALHVLGTDPATLGRAA